MTDKRSTKTRKATSAKAATVDDVKANPPRVTEQVGKSGVRAIAELSQSPVLGGVLTSRTFVAGIAEIIDLTESLAVMRAKADKVQAGDLAEAEVTLLAQAVTLDTIFNTLARRAALNMDEHLNAADTCLRLALKAQSQCRATLETLAEIKNPRAVAFVKQANIAHGPQQVNNATAAGESLAHAGNNIKPSNELLGVSDGERLDISAQSATSAANQELAPVGKIDGATH